MGLFGGNKKKGEDGGAGQVEAAEAALEAVAALLRTLGRHVLTLDGTPPEAVTRRFEEWARHVLLRTPTPDREAAEAPAEKPAAAASDRPAPRDWPGLQRFVTDQRRNEASLVSETVAGLREAARSFVRAMTRLRLVGDSADLGVRTQIERLRHAANASSPVELKRDVLAAADALDAAVESRRSQEESVAADLAAQVKDLSHQLDNAIREGGTDPLTRLANRKALDAAIAEAVELCTVTREPVCVVMVDLDDFKGINDRFGHGAGDEVLKGVADTLSRIILRQRDVVARYAGDEFCVLLRDCTMATGRQLITRVADAVRMLSFERNGEHFGIDASYGLTALKAEDTAATFMERADQALYQVKRAGKGKVGSN